MLNLAGLAVDTLDELNLLTIFRGCRTGLESLARKIVKRAIHYMLNAQVLWDSSVDRSDGTGTLIDSQTV